ncbi:MAG: glucose-1-phosphate cytidylyltransferase [Tropicimonas sp.]|uniref:glucose-1-phosphate cytidylyltransferase n=1 Tax=Tropicimonas sp. TaxID=2067044 RepID=UPI003A893754
MKAVILAGGYGTRISEESHRQPKPMITIGGRPILWHIMSLYSAHDITDFVICCGYKGYMIKEYFANYFLHMSDVTFHMADNRMEVHRQKAEPWTVTLVDTGEKTMTGGRLKRVAEYIDDTFCLTYGDGVADVDLTALRAFHGAAGRQATVTAVRPSARFGALAIEEDQVTSFVEKPEGDGRWINGGFFVCEPSVLDRIEGDDMPWESAPLESLAADGQLSVYKHTGFWMAMDTMRDRATLEKMWAAGNAPWRTWS